MNFLVQTDVIEVPPKWKINISAMLEKILSTIAESLLKKGRGYSPWLVTSYDVTGWAYSLQGKKKQNKQTTKEVIAFRSVNRKAQQKIRTLFGYWADQGLKGLALHPWMPPQLLWFPTRRWEVKLSPQAQRCKVHLVLGLVNSLHVSVMLHWKSKVGFVHGFDEQHFAPHPLR